MFFRVVRLAAALVAAVGDVVEAAREGRGVDLLIDGSYLIR